MSLGSLCSLFRAIQRRHEEALPKSPRGTSVSISIGLIKKIILILFAIFFNNIFTLTHHTKRPR